MVSPRQHRRSKHDYNNPERTDVAQTYLWAACRILRGPNALLVAPPKRAELRKDPTTRLGAAAAGQCRVSGKAVFTDIWGDSSQAPLARGGKPWSELVTLASAMR